MAESVRDESALVVTHSGDVQLGTLYASTPDALVAGAEAMATTLADVINKQGLYTNIQGRNHVKVEGWLTLAVMLGCTAREVSNEAQPDGSYVATVELVRMSDGTIIARASAECGMDEPTWANRARYARRSMAATRATGKACRLAFSWVMALAGYDTTPLEEVPSEERDVSPKRASVARSTVAEVFNAPASKPFAVATPSGDVISDPQRRRLLAITYQLGDSAGLKKDQTESEVKAVLSQHGYSSTKDIKRSDYDTIIDEASRVLRGYAEPVVVSDDAAAAQGEIF